MLIDILVRVYDNLGDMGFAYELASSLQRERSEAIEFRFFTDDVEKLGSFFSLQGSSFQVYSEHCWHDVDHRETQAFFVLFRSDFTPEMLSSLPMGIPTLWIDYLAFDLSIAAMSGQEHILSSVDHPVYHLVNSPYSGLLPPHRSLQAIIAPPMRYEILRELSGAYWSHQSSAQLVFSYQTREVIESISTLDTLTMGFGPIAQVEPVETYGLLVPYQSLDDFYRLFLCVDAMIVRGEVSLASALHSGTPFYWDMYKALGGWNEHEHRCFLEWVYLSFEALDAHMLFDRYAQTSYRLNQSYQMTAEDMHFLRSSELRAVFADIRERAARVSLTQSILSFIR